MTLLNASDVVKVMTGKIEKLKTSLNGKQPNLAIIRVGARADDIAYERGAEKRLSTLGIRCRLDTFPEDITQAEFVSSFKAINSDKNINGILLLRPLPKQLDISDIEKVIDPQKDVDGMGLLSAAKLFMGIESGFVPCTAEAVMEILDNSGCELRGKKVVIVGCGNVVGKPLAMLMFERDATVTVCNEFTKELAQRCRQADILVAAAGVRKLIGAEHVGPECMVVDVGINVDESGNLCGDVDFEKVAPIVKGITPVPGGVGLVTMHVLAMHVIQATCIQT